MPAQQNRIDTTRPLLPRLRMRGLKAHQTAKGTVAWSGIILLDGKPALRVSNDGNGGCNMYAPAEAEHPFRGLVDAIEAECRTATGLCVEAFDAVAACMENGQTAASVITLVRQHFSRAVD